MRAKRLPNAFNLLILLAITLIFVFKIGADCAYLEATGDINGTTDADLYLLPCPVGYWHFDQCLDSKFIGPDAHGGVTCGSSNFQSAAVFDGIDDKIEVPDRPQFHFTTAMTLAAWVNPESTDGLRTIINKWYAPDSYILMIENGQYVFRVAFPDGSWGKTVQVSYPAASKTWTHVAGTFDGQRIMLYINGGRVASKEAVGVIQDSGRPLVIGNHPSWNAFQGKIDEVRLYNISLRPSEIAELVQFIPNQKALMLVDHRLYTEVTDELDKYRCLVERRREFDVSLHDIPDIDNWFPEDIKEYLISQHSSLEDALGNLEGVLFIGNIKIPTFCLDYGNIRLKGLVPSFYENLDAIYAKDNPPADCVEPFDFNTWTEGQEFGPEIWVSFLPVGFADTTRNTYSGYAEQIRPFLNKVIQFYEDGVVIEKKLYQVSNQLWYELGDSWDYYGPDGIDFYAVNPDPKGTIPPGTPAGEYCLRNGRTTADCYIRAPMEQYVTFDDFWQYYLSREWMGEGWQDGNIYKEHMKAHVYEFVWVNTHADEGWSLISSAEARVLENGGIVMLGSGCNVGRFSQPDGNLVSSAMPNENLLINYIYGSSHFISATGSTFTRQWEPRFAELVDLAHNEPYFGKAYRENRRANGMSWLEILVGDPFLDFNRETTWEELGQGVHGADLVSDGEYLYRVGGIGHCTNIYKYDGLSNTWTLLTDANPQCWSHFSPGEGNRSWYYGGKIIVAGHSHPGHPGGNKVTMYDIENDTWTSHELPLLGDFSDLSWGQLGALNAITGEVYISWTEDWGTGHEYVTSALDVASGTWGPTYDRDSRIGQGHIVLEDTSGLYVFDLIRGDRYLQLRIYNLQTQPEDFSGTWTLSSTHDMGDGLFFMDAAKSHGSDVMAWSPQENKLYLVATEHGVTLEYDPDADSWRKLAQRPIGHGYRDGHVVVVGEYLYSQNGDKLWYLSIP